MKTMLISAASTVFIFGMAFAREVAVSPVVVPHAAATIVERRVVQSSGLDRETGVPCTTKHITTITADGSRSTRKSVDCQE
jgi:hypothetical protein